jgi:serine phosphatase RsbU (regulator of sigma subunit)
MPYISVPDDVRGAGVCVAGRQIPAAGTAAGDWAEVFGLPGRRVGLSVGDASGHDPEASVQAEWLRKLLRAGLVNGYEPGVVVRRAVEQLGETGERSATAFVAVLDPADGLLRYTNAGHPEALHLRRARSGRVPNGVGVSVVGPTGPMLADVFAGQDAWSTAAVRLDVDDTMVVYTDGLVEARDASGVQFGVDRLMAEAIRSSQGRTPSRLLDDLLTAVEKHAYGSYAETHRDDRTALILTRTATIPQPRGGSASPGLP